jgi:hypothetical protein
MKKIFLIAAAAVFALVACDNKENGENEENKVPEVKTCAENLVLYMPFEGADNAVKVGEGLTFDKKAGAADFGAGYIGKGYVNTSGKNDEAYLKFKLAANNAISKLENVTITVWVKNVEEFQKGGLFSANGKHFATQDWPSMVVMFDNKSVDDETGTKNQQINGRLMFKTAEGAETNMWLDTWDTAFAKYGSWFQFAFTYEAASGAWALYVDGVQVKTAEYGDKMKFGGCVPADANAFYVGGWSSWIESYTGAQDWQSFFAGSIDELRMYNKVLTEAEIQALRREEVAIALS